MALPELISVEDLFSAPERTAATISPDGTRIAYLAPWQNRLNVWVQDVDDDALIGIRSTARLFGDRVKPAVAGFYAGGYVLWMSAALLVGAGWVTLAGSVVVIAILGWQVATMDRLLPGNPLVRFKANHWAGLALTAVLLIDALA